METSCCDCMLYSNWKWIDIDCWTIYLYICLSWHGFHAVIGESRRKFTVKKRQKFWVAKSRTPVSEVTWRCGGIVKGHAVYLKPVLKLLPIVSLSVYCDGPDALCTILRCFIAFLYSTKRNDETKWRNRWTIIRGLVWWALYKLYISQSWRPFGHRIVPDYHICLLLLFSWFKPITFKG